MALTTIRDKNAVVIGELTGPRRLFKVKEGPITKCSECDRVLPPGSFVTRGCPGHSWAVMCSTCRPFEITDSTQPIGNASQAETAIPVTWGLVELMGHSKVAGRISEETRYGSTWLRVDVPEADNQIGFSQLYGAGAVYRITYTTEEIARLIAQEIHARPIKVWELNLLPEPEEPPPDYGEYDPPYEPDPENPEPNEITFDGLPEVDLESWERAERAWQEQSETGETP